VRRFEIARQFDNSITITERVSQVCRMFGVSVDRLRGGRLIHKCEIEVEEGNVVYITGPSGAGKSVLLKEIERCVPADERINIDEIPLPADKAVIDCIGQCKGNMVASNGCGCDARFVERKTSNVTYTPDNYVRVQASCATNGRLTQPATAITTIEVLRLLCYAGLSEVFCILTAPANLSEGQKYRFRLACALAAGRPYVFADEFCSNLDRIMAAVIAYNVRRFAKRNGVTFFLASSHEDILADLQPDVLVVKNFTGPAEVVYKKSTSAQEHKSTSRKRLVHS
jgi:ABC-type ATPase with predicted acetyltransferase domain